VKISIFRFVQEGLNNAYRHGQGIGQAVKCNFDGRQLKLTVSDAGPGFEQENSKAYDGRLGLVGLRERIESLGATLQIQSAPGQGTQLTMQCNIQSDEAMPPKLMQASS